MAGSNDINCDSQQNAYHTALDLISQLKAVFLPNAQKNSYVTYINYVS